MISTFRRPRYPRKFDDLSDNLFDKVLGFVVSELVMMGHGDMLRAFKGVHNAT